MNTLKFKIISTLTLIFLMSCNREDAVSVKENKNGVNVVELSKTTSYQGAELGIYGMEFGALNDFTLRNKITRYRYSDGYKNHLNSFALTRDLSQINNFKKVAFGNIIFEKTSKIMEPLFLKEIRAKNTTFSKQKTEDKVNQIVDENFGKKKKFTIEADKYTIKKTMYIPKVIEINNIGNFDESINAYWVDKNNFSIQYNQDIHNKNGVALLILWDGSRQDMSLRELANLNMGYKNKIVVFDPNDTGIFNIPSYAISKFPRYANITVVLIRGNAEIIEKEAKSNYLVTSSEQYEHIVLSN